MVLLVITTFPDAEVAANVIRTLVEEKLAACGSIIPGVRSLYAWEGKIEDSAEVMVVFKTASTVYAKLEKRLLKLHPYETPEVLALEPGAVNRAYAEWIAAAVAAS
jgi:periplasmic divalent cation tolerance protein